VDDRLLFVPPVWCPDAAVFERWASVRTFMRTLRRIMPVDILRLPTLRGMPREGKGVECTLNAIRAQLRPEHHIVDAGGTAGEALLLVLSTSSAQSLTLCGFYPHPRHPEFDEDPGAATIYHTIVSLMVSGPAQMVPIVMNGAAEWEIAEAVARVDRTLDREVLQEIQWPSPMSCAIVETPTLLLSLPAPVPMSDAAFAVLSRIAPNARHDTLNVWGTRVHEGDGGDELAGKVIAFIDRVITRRDEAWT
jgi:hypothetical protein